MEFDEAGIQLPSGLNFIVALPRPQMLKRILEFSATVSASRVMLIRSSRVEKSFFQSPLLEESQIREHLVREQAVAVLCNERVHQPLLEEMGTRRSRAEQLTIRARRALHLPSLFDPRPEGESSRQALDCSAVS